MNYEFPIITHLDQVRSVIDGQDGFIIVEREWGFVANYVQMGNQTFPEIRSEGDAIRRECRGILFGLDGNLISRPFHKFFNVGEREETLLCNIDLSRPHVILEKMDGSLVRAVPMPSGGYRLGTKMGITEVAMQAEVFVASHSNYDRFFRDTIAQGYTALFEWCSRKQRIVIDYPEDRLVLLAMRNNLDGVYLPMNKLRQLATEYGLDLVLEYAGTSSNMEHLLAETHDLQGQEGWIVRFDDGHMLKLKGSEYVTMHRAKDNLLREWGVIEMLLDEKADDVKAFLPDEDRRRLERYEEDFWQGVMDTQDRWHMSYLDCKGRFGADRKGFALEWAPGFDQHLRGAIFKAWDNPDFDFRTYLLDTVRRNLGTQAKIDAARHLWGSAVWNYSDQGEE
jgi:RNA ligase